MHHKQPYHQMKVSSFRFLRVFFGFCFLWFDKIQTVLDGNYLPAVPITLFLPPEPSYSRD